MALSSEKLSRMAEYQKRLLRQKADALATRKAEAHEEVRKLVGKFLALDPTIDKIILFGSLARDDVSSLEFDIDLAVSCSAVHFLSLVALALDCPIKVDLVDIDTADNRIKSAIEREGVVLYEK